MYSKIYQIEVPGLAEGKIAAAFMAEELTPLISRYNMAGLSVFLCKEGMVQITVNFDSPGDMKLFQEAQAQIFAQLKNSFSCSTGEYQAVPVFRYEREATNSSMQVTHQKIKSTPGGGLLFPAALRKFKKSTKVNTLRFQIPKGNTPNDAKVTAMNETQIRSVSLGKGFGQSNPQSKVTKFHAYTLALVLVGLPTSSVTLAQIEVLKIWLDRRDLPS